MYIKNNSKNEVTYLFTDGRSQIFKFDVVAIVTKFDDVFKIVNHLLQTDEELRVEYEKFLTEYIDSTDRMKVFLLYIEKLLYLIDRDFDKEDFSKGMVVKENSAYQMNINFEESVLVLRSSIRTRFFLACYLSDFKVEPDQQKVIHSYICREMIDTGVVEKLYKILNSIILATYPDKSGKRIWDLLSASGGINSDSHVLKILSSIFYKALPSLNPSDNPIAYMISIAKNEVSWLLRTNLVVNIHNSSIDTDSIMNERPNSKVIESETYYRTIVRHCFDPTAQDYRAYSKLKTCNVLPTVYNISQVLIQRIFNVPLKYIVLDDMSVVNFFTHHFLKTYDPSKTTIMKMLLAIPIYSNAGPITKEMKNALQLEISERRNIKAFPYLAYLTVKKIFAETVSNLYRYNYIDPITNTEIDIDWIEFIHEFVDYVYNTALPAYQEGIKIEKEAIKF